MYWSGVQDAVQQFVQNGVVFLLCIQSLCLASDPAIRRPFTAIDDVGLAQFHNLDIQGTLISFSPDNRFFAVLTERGVLNLNAPEDTIWIFRVDDVKKFVQDPHEKLAPSPSPLVRRAGEKDGPILERVRWLEDSSGVAFLAVSSNYCCQFHQLFVADLRSQVVKAMTPDNQDVLDFDCRNVDNFVYEVGAPTILDSSREESDNAEVVLTGRSLESILFPDKPRVQPFDEAGLWAVTNGIRYQVRNSQTKEPLLGNSSLSMSRNGHFVVSISKVEHPPYEWRKYRSPEGLENRPPLSPLAFHLIDLKRGTRTLLINAPTGLSRHWGHVRPTANWSDDQQSLVLSNTFLPLDTADPKEQAHRESRPCLAVLRIKSQQLTCVLPIKAGLEKNREDVSYARFVDDRSVVIHYDRSSFMPQGSISELFHQRTDGRWILDPGAGDASTANLPIRVEIREDINHPPVIAVGKESGGTVRNFWDPNPQLSELELGHAEVFSWSDESGYQWHGGLVKPVGYMPGRHYPLVIQTHGFNERKFLSNGSFTTAFAAQALASKGIMVLQMGTNPNRGVTAQEGVDQIAGFESAVEELSNEGMIDSTKVGIIGFSRTVFHVLEALTNSKFHFAAASVTEGVTFGYYDYIINVDQDPDIYAKEAEQINGGSPVEPEGLANWLVNSPDFNMSKVKTPLLFLQPGKETVWSDWEPYAALRYLKKPVELIMLQPGTHVMTNPRQRLASETINVDWFSFWLTDKEVADSVKTDQYRRWRSLKQLQQLVR